MLFVYPYSPRLGYQARAQYGEINQYQATKDESILRKYFVCYK